jgi:hypothetical protein
MFFSFSTVGSFSIVSLSWSVVVVPIAQFVVGRGDRIEPQKMFDAGGFHCWARDIGQEGTDIQLECRHDGERSSFTLNYVFRQHMGEDNGVSFYLQHSEGRGGVNEAFRIDMWCE